MDLPPPPPHHPPPFLLYRLRCAKSIAMHTGKRRSLMPMYKEQLLGACELLHFPLVLVNRLNKTKSAVFLYCRFSLFLKTVCIQISLYPNKFNPYLRAFCMISSKRITDNSAQNQLGQCQLGPHKTRPLPTRPKFIRQLGPNP